MTYLKDLLDRLGTALRITSPRDAQAGSTTTNQTGPVQEPAGPARP